jgi:hypothetical protein
LILTTLPPRRALVVALDDPHELLDLLQAQGIETYRIREPSDLAQGRWQDFAPDLLVFLGRAPTEPLTAHLPPHATVVWLPLPTSSVPGDDQQNLTGRKAPFTLTALHERFPRTLVDEQTTEQAPSSRGAPLHLDVTSGRLHRGRCSVAVTRAECDLLRVFLASRGQWISGTDLKWRAFGPEHRSQNSLIRVHVHKLRKKLYELSVRIDSIRGLGYRLT